MNLADLVHFIGAGEEGEKGHHLEEHASHPPHIHLVAVVPVRQQALRRPVPSRRDVLRIGLLGVDPTTAAQIRQLQGVIPDEDVLRLDITVEDAVPVHVVHCLTELVHVHLNLGLRKIMPSPPDALVHVHVHQLKHQGQSAGGLVVQHLVQLDDVGVRRQPPQGLDLTQVVHLLHGVEVVFHAFDGHVPPGLDGLGLQHLGEGPLPLLGYQPVLVHGSLSQRLGSRGRDLAEGGPSRRLGLP
mmetsp:Transcript_103958/g.238005  ORF Transcript_103958/g.238005 Transcript_103958/m.238005 type:complete len:242 (-) Transcript_103958:19-744(-)